MSWKGNRGLKLGGRWANHCHQYCLTVVNELVAYREMPFFSWKHTLGTWTYHRHFHITRPYMGVKERWRREGRSIRSGISTVPPSLALAPGHPWLPCVNSCPSPQVPSFPTHVFDICRLWASCLCWSLWLSLWLSIWVIWCDKCVWPTDSKANMTLSVRVNKECMFWQYCTARISINSEKRQECIDGVGCADRNPW